MPNPATWCYMMVMIQILNGALVADGFSQSFSVPSHASDDSPIVEATHWVDWVSPFHYNWMVNFACGALLVAVLLRPSTTGENKRKSQASPKNLQTGYSVIHNPSQSHRVEPRQTLQRGWLPMKTVVGTWSAAAMVQGLGLSISRWPQSKTRLRAPQQNCWVGWFRFQALPPVWFLNGINVRLE